MIHGLDQGDTLLENLVYAINSQNLNKVKEILKRGGFDINEEVYKTRALVFAIEDSTIEIIRELIKNGADVNLPGFESKTPLHVAILERNIPIIKLLLENGADVNKKSGADKGGFTEHMFYETPLYTAVLINFIPVVKLLLENGADVNQPSINPNYGENGKNGENEEETPLALAIRYDNQTIAKILLNHPKIIIDDNTIDMIDDTTLEIQYLIFEKLGPLEQRKIAKNNATNVITMQNIETGTNMINFHDEFKHGRYYTKNTFNRLPIKNAIDAKENPATVQPIYPENIKRYKAVVAGGGKRGGARTRRKRGSKRKTRRHNKKK